MRQIIGTTLIMIGSAVSFSLWLYWSYGCAINFKMNYDETGNFLASALLAFLAFLFNSFIAWLIGITTMFIGVKISGEEE